MEHVVFFPAPDGSAAFRRLASLEDAVRLVEHLRNVEGVAEVSVHALSEVPLAFRAWYRVEMPAAAPADSAQAAAASPPTEELADVAVPGVEATGVEAAEVEATGVEAAGVEVPAVQVAPDRTPVAAEQVVPVLAGTAVPVHEVETPASLGFFA